MFCDWRAISQKYVLVSSAWHISYGHDIHIVVIFERKEDIAEIHTYASIYGRLIMMLMF